MNEKILTPFSTDVYGIGCLDCGQPIAQQLPGGIGESVVAFKKREDAARLAATLGTEVVVLKMGYLAPAIKEKEA